ncbi:MAG: DUF4129 domain-containing protein [Anaerolineales bacterium]|nr:DUF4129 domain-containing protein [Anaerolineales bacterium]
MIRSLFQSRSWILTLSILALAALTVLVSGLGEISFRDSQPLVRNNPNQILSASRGALEAWQGLSLWTQIVVWLALLLLVFLIGMLLTPETRKLLLRLFLRLAATYWLLYFLFTRYGDQLALNALQLLNPNANNLPAVNDVPAPVFTPSAGMVWAAYAVSFVIVLAALVVSWRTYQFFRGSSEPSETKNMIAKIVRSSIRDLSFGGNSSDVIMNCYYRMSEAVADSRNLHRRDSMTPAEFAARLEQAGLPGEAVSRLTRLFEAVRYGGRRSGPQEIREATACLNAILNHCEAAS